MTFKAWIALRKLDAAKLAKLADIPRNTMWRFFKGETTLSNPNIRKIVDASRGDLSFEAVEREGARRKAAFAATADGAEKLAARRKHDAEARSRS